MIVYPDSFKAKRAQSWDELSEIIAKSSEDCDYFIPGHGLAAYVRVKGFSLSSSADYIIVGFSGAVKNQGLESGPFFSFTSVSEEVGLPLISFSDPSLMLDPNLTLGWHLGNKYIPDYPSKIARLLDILAEKTGKKILLSGGSGGGFAALNVANKMREQDSAIALVWNPQVVIKNYYENDVNRYIEAGWGGDLESVKNSRVVPSGAKAVFLMDGLDHAHLRLHLREYLKNEPSPVKAPNGYYIYNNSAVLVGDWGSGHSAPPKVMIVHNINEIVRNGGDFSSFSKIKMSKKVVDFSNNNLYENMLTDASPSVSIVSRNFMVETSVNRKYVGYQIRYRVVDGEGNAVMESSWLKNYHNCRVFGVIPKGMELKDTSSWRVMVVMQDYFGTTKSFGYEFNKRMKKYYYMKHC